MATEKACKHCRTVFEGSKCPECGSIENVEGFKGKVRVLDSEQSEIAQKLNIKKKGKFAIRLK